MAEPKKVQGGAAFDALMGKLVQVPKKELDRAEKRYQKKRAKKRKK
jgi:hypothetical protein